MKNALIIVDVQNDFVEGGSLAVTGGRAVAAGLAAHLADGTTYDHVVTTQDWHIDPGDHWADDPNFTTTWPVHCAANTDGAELVDTLAAALGDTITVRKGQYEAAYSGFEGTVGDNQKLADVLRDLGVTHVTITGIATDHCVKATANDALTAGFGVTILTDLVAGVDADASKVALAELEAAGAILI